METGASRSIVRSTRRAEGRPEATAAMVAALLWSLTAIQDRWSLFGDEDCSRQQMASQDRERDDRGGREAICSYVCHWARGCFALKWAVAARTTPFLEI